MNLNIKSKWLTSVFTGTLLNVMIGCSGGTQTAVTAGLGEAKVVAFTGVKSVTPNEDGTWTVWWQATSGIADVTYRIYQRTKSEQFDFRRPVASSTVSNYITGDLRLIGNTCFVVRFYQVNNSEDKNTNEICTGHSPYSFLGVDTIQSLRDGTYMLTWPAASFKGVRYGIYQKTNGNDTLQNIAETEQNFYQTRPLGLDQKTCFVVRYIIENFPVDKNSKEVCTIPGDQFLFAGVTSLSSPGGGQLEVTWTPLDAPNIGGYYVYIGSEFRPEMRQQKITDPKASSALIKNLQHAVIYTIGVRAFDKFGREDENTKVISFELKNHIPVVDSLDISVLSRNSDGKPTEMECVADYNDEDSWQNLKPKFWIRNNKRDNLGVIERVAITGAKDQKKVTYKLVSDDYRKDQIYCEIQINDGFNETAVIKSPMLTIPDTPVKATGLNLATTENAIIEVAFARGEGLGYIDTDQDNAQSVIFTTTNGDMVSDPPFLCIEGVCVGKFKPKMDFYTDLGAIVPQLATIQYQIKAGDSISNLGVVQVSVKPVPRALGFDMIAQQEEDRSGIMGTELALDPDGKISTFAAYKHVLNKNATMVYIRQPLYQQDSNGTVRLPANITADPSKGIGCKVTSVSGWTKPGFECGIPCTNGRCPFVYRGDYNYYGLASFDYAVVVDGIQSNYASARISILPNLRAIGINGLTVEGQNYKLKFFEGVGFKGSSNGMTVTRIDVVSTDGNESSIATFTQTAPNVWESLYIPKVGFSGTVEFSYRVRAAKDGKIVESDVGKASIWFYPRPVATNVNLQMLQDISRSINIRFGGPGTKIGYTHSDSAKASKAYLEQINLAKGSVVPFGATATLGDIPCINGDCLFEYAGAVGYYDPDGSTDFKKLAYSIEIEIPSDIMNNPTILLDDFLTVPANRKIKSNLGWINAQIRPIPVARALDYVIREATPTRASNLAITVSKVGATPEYFHPFSYKAESARIVTPPLSGSITPFSCATDGTCTATYTAAIGQIGQLTPNLLWNLTVVDPVYTLSTGRISSLDNSISIDVRPVPKTTGANFAVAENTTFAPSSKDLVVSRNAGYTHIDGLSATGFDIAEKVGLSGTLTAGSCVGGVCTSTFTPNQNSYGLRTFQYRVWINDSKLGLLDSEYNDIMLDVRPLPRASDLGTIGNQASWVRVNENEAKTISLELSQQYTHPYAFPAKSVQIMGFTPLTGTTPTVSCDPQGKCLLTYTPPTGYEGPATIDYQVQVLDPVLSTNLASNTARIYLDVYPAPRATNRRMLVLENQTSTIRLDLKTGKVLNEDTEPLYRLRKGYAHRRDDFATSVAMTNPTRGTLGNFLCNSGVCDATYQTPPYINGVIDNFQYKVSVGGLLSPTFGTYEIEVRPTAHAQNLNKIIKQNEAYSIDLKVGPTEAYTHPLSKLASRIDVVSVANGTATVVDLELGDATNTCDATFGTCRVTFTPNLNFWTPDGNPTAAHFTYRLWTWDDEMGQDVASNVAQVNFNVRPIPIANGYAVAAIQGTQPQIVMSDGANTGFSYPSPTGSSLIKIKTSNVASGSLAKSDYTCATVNCEAITFVPSVDGTGEFYYGNGSKFDYILVVNDPLLGTLESAPATATIDFRPKPKAMPFTIKLWQKSDKIITIDTNNGYYHPYYAGNPATYKPSAVTLTAPLSASIGQILAPLFTCSTNVPYQCLGTFRPHTNYYYSPANGYDYLTYKTSVLDPVLGTIDSDPSTIALEVKPIPINLGKSVLGVQSAPKNIAIAPGDGYTYPNSFDVFPPQIMVVGTPYRGSIAAGGITCVKPSGLCSGVFNASDSTITGVASFDYKIQINDPDLGIYESSTQTYNIDFYPRPHVTDFLSSVGKQIQAVEGANKLVKMAPGSYPSGAYCFPALHSSLGMDSSYRHELCDVNAELNIISTVNGVFPGLTKLDYSTTDKSWSGTFNPDAINGSWPGYGLANFRYQVKLTPAALSGVPLSVFEVTALTSEVATAEIEFYPRPYATTVTLKNSNPAWDYVWGVQGKTSPFTVTRCDTPAVQSNCFDGYVQGYNQNADLVEFRNWSNISQFSSLTCDALGICSTMVLPSGSFFTSTTNYATFDYRVRVANFWSDWVTQKVNVYPTPVAQDRISSGITGDVPLSIDLGQGYTHLMNAKAVKVLVVNWPDATKGNLVDMSDTSNVLTNSAANMTKAFTCDTNGRCTGIYRPVAGDDNDNLFYFRVQIEAPNGMPPNLASQILSDVKRYDVKIFPKPRVQTTEIVAVEGTTTIFEVGLNKGYTHRNSKYATKLMFMNGDRNGSGQIIVKNGDSRGVISGSISCDVGNTQCYLGCADGTCTGFFTPSAGVHAITAGQTPFACDVLGSDCPNVDFNVAVKDTGGTELVSIADLPAVLRFNVRHKPTVPAGIIDLLAPEGDALPISMTRPIYYDHSVFNANDVTDMTTTKGLIIGGAFSCNTLLGTCDGNFVPTPGWVPVPGDKYATLNYKVTVYDPTNRTDSPTPVGLLKTDGVGQIRIEYRPKPRATTKTYAMAENEVTSAFRTVTLALNDGYTHSNGLLAKKLLISQDSSLQKVTIANGTCNGTYCEVTCDVLGQCPVELIPQANYYGTGGFQYLVVVSDAAFTPPRDLLSPSPGTVTVDIRPIPVASALTLNSPQNSNLTITLLNSAGQGYIHPVYNYNAVSTQILTGPLLGTLSTPISCITNVVDANYRKCIGVYSPNVNIFGYDYIDYKVSVFDPILGRNITSGTQTLTIRVRPVPAATGFATNWTTREAMARTLTLLQSNVLTDKLGYWFPNSTAPEYDIHPSSTLITQAPSPTLGAFPGGGFTCTTGIQSPKGCSALFTPVVDQSGLTPFKYKIRTNDAYLGMFTSNEATINIDVRPIPHAQAISFKAIEGTDYNWTIDNGAGLGYTYPTGNTSVLATTEILPQAFVNGSGISANCNTTGVCTGVFRPQAGFRDGAASFNFRIRMTDTILDVTQTGDQYILSGLQTASVDIYPKPDAVDKTFYVLQDSALSLKVDRGATNSFTHLRNHNPSQVVVQSQSQLQPITNGSFTCSGTDSFCTASITPASGFFSATNTIADAANFTYRIDVTEPGASPRTARSDNTGTASIIVYPYSVPAFTTTIVGYEGESTPVTIDRGVGVGYTHPWNHNATAITEIARSTGSTATGFTCVLGSCTGTFTPKVGTVSADYGTNKAWFDYKTTTNFANISPSSVPSATTGRVNFYVAATPRIVTPWTKNGFIENTPFDFDVVRNAGYTYLDDSNYASANVFIVYQNPYKVSCTGGTICDGVTEYACTANGNKTCRVTLNPQTDWTRLDGNASIQYKIGITDTATGAVKKWSAWSTVNFPLIPQPRNPTASGVNEFIKTDAISGTPYNFAISLDNGYTHRENAYANKMTFYPSGAINTLSPAADTTQTCTTGNCTVTITPSATTFAAVPARGQNAATSSNWGWASFQYSVESLIDGVTVLPPTTRPKGNGYIFFRPVPQPENISNTKGIENTNLTVTIRNNDGTTCTSNCGYLFPNETLAGVTQHYASAISVTNITGGGVVQGTPSCNASGVCTVVMKRTTAGPVTFDYKVTVNGVVQAVASTANLYFQGRARSNNLSRSTSEGVPLEIDISTPTAYTQVDNSNAGTVTITSIVNALNGKIYWLDGPGGNETECLGSPAKICIDLRT